MKKLLAVAAVALLMGCDGTGSSTTQPSTKPSPNLVVVTVYSGGKNIGVWHVPKGGIWQYDNGHIAFTDAQGKEITLKGDYVAEDYKEPEPLPLR